MRERTEDPVRLASIDRSLAAMYAKEPPTDFQVSICINAWHDLGTCRGIGMALGPIPVTAIYAWCEVEGLDLEATKLMKNVIRQLDNERSVREAAKQRLRDAK